MSTPDTNPRGQPAAPFLTRVRVRNFRSLVDCDVELGPLNVLVGRNGAGKSNFLDAIRFVGDALRSSPADAIRSRGGFGSLQPCNWSERTGPLPPTNLSIKLDLDVGNGRRAGYGFEIRPYSRQPVDFPSWVDSRETAVVAENLEIREAGGDLAGSYSIKAGEFCGQPDGVMPPIVSDRLYLVNAAGLPKFRDVYDALLMTRFYNLDPASMKAARRPDAGDFLRPDGENLASVIGRLEAERPAVMVRLNHYLASIVPEVGSVNRMIYGPMATLDFKMKPGRSLPLGTFFADAMSDGTPRALGALVAVNQLAEGSVPVKLVGIEEPETALHPAASGVLMDALREAAVHTQVVVTTHSPDLLDQLDPETDRLLVVQARGGETEIGPIDPASREALRGHLDSPGELFRMDQLEPDRSGRRPGLKASAPPGGSG